MLCVQFDKSHFVLFKKKISHNVCSKLSSQCKNLDLDCNWKNAYCLIKLQVEMTIDTNINKIIYLSCAALSSGGFQKLTEKSVNKWLQLLIF